VPRGTIAAHIPPTDIVLSELDGTGRDTLALSHCSGNWLLGGVRWAPDGEAFVYHAYMNPGGSAIAIHLAEPNGACRRVSETTAWHTNPSFSPDGAWIYVNVTVFPEKSEVWRMRPDGTELSRVGLEATGSERDLWPTVSPDGRTVSFWTTRTPGGLGLIDLETGGFSILPIQAEVPRWSPVGDLLAYIRDARLRVARPDLSNERMLGNEDVEPSRHQYYDWSPDGEWIIRSARPQPGLVLVRVADGLMIPLTYLAGLQSPAWRPCSGPSC
jgi:Tol biopolymer transport system component